MEQNILKEIATTLKKSIEVEIFKPRKSTTYGGPGMPGVPKPVSGKFPTPISPAVSSGNLINNIKVFWDGGFEQGGIPELVVEMPLSGLFVDQGRRPGKFPPLLPILQWIREKPVSRFRSADGRFLSNNVRAFFIQRSIGKYGFGGNNFLNKAFEKALPIILDELGDAAAAFFEFQLDSKNITVRYTE